MLRLLLLPLALAAAEPEPPLCRDVMKRPFEAVCVVRRDGKPFGVSYKPLFSKDWTGWVAVAQFKRLGWTVDDEALVRPADKVKLSWSDPDALYDLAVEATAAQMLLAAEQRRREANARSMLRSLAR